MKTRLLFILLLSLTLPSCGVARLIDGLRQTNPNYNGPLLRKWWKAQG
jgi:hypothetical protein